MMRRFVLVLAGAIILAAVLWAVPWEAKEGPAALSFPSVRLGLEGAATALAQAGSTFPTDEAGLAAYLRVSPLSVENVLPAFDGWEHYGNWVKGHLSVKRYPAWNTEYPFDAISVTIYFDSQGWVVAYLPKGTAPAAMMMWTSISQGSSNLTSISTALEEALRRVLLAAGVDFAPLREQVRYYHFQYPEAKSIGIWGKVATVPQGQEVSFRLSMVNVATIYSESVFVLSPNGAWPLDLSSRSRPWTVGGSPGIGKREIDLGNIYNYNNFQSYDYKMIPGLDYKYLMNNPTSENQTLGIAVVLIYTLP